MLLFKLHILKPDFVYLAKDGVAYVLLITLDKLKQLRNRLFIGSSITFKTI